MIKFIIPFIFLFNLFGIIYADDNFYVRLIHKESATQLRRMDQPTTSSVPLIGLDKLKFSASEQFSQNGFINIMMDLSKKDLIIVDLRREHHGFVNGIAVGWYLTSKVNGGPCEYNIGLSQQEIEKGELKLLKDLSNAGSFYGREKDSTIDEIVTVESYSSERELVEQAGAKYLRIPILDHTRPLDSQVDEIVKLVKTLPKDSWLHLHCAGGKGRTTTVSSMIDMMHNSSKLSAVEIIKRQQALGGSNLWDTEDVYNEREPILIERGIERREFLCLFHQYCLENPDFKVNWSSWAKKVARQTSQS